MVNLFDIMRSSQSGAGLDNLARQFGLSPTDTQRAVEALLPAFSLGFQRNVHDPSGFASLMQMLSSGRYAPFFDGPQMPNPALWASGSEALTNILGSPQVSRKVAEQAAAATGIGVDILQQMMPMVAATIMGGAFRYASLEGLGDVFANWSRAFHKAHDAQQPSRRTSRAPEPPANPFELWAAMMPGAATPAAPAPPPKASAAQNPVEVWSSMVDALLGATPTAAPAPDAAPSSAPSPVPNAAANPLRVLSQMFEAGSSAQSQYIASLQGIMGQGWEAGRKP